jgi:hypothetical protein
MKLVHRDPVEFDPEFAAPADWAAMYRACGIQIVPAHAPHPTKNWKRPQLADWKTLQEDLVPDATFERWYGVSGEYARQPNMGIITGRASGNTFVIDLDDYKTPSAREWWQGVLVTDNYGIEPETWQQVTGGGGRQLLFRAPPGRTIGTGKTSIGVDIRGQGGFAVLPPSKHSTGRNYAWRYGFSPWETTIADAPPWLLDAVEALLREHGHEQTGSVERTASPAESLNAFGALVDGREAKMTSIVWGALIDLRIARDEIPADGFGSQMREAFGVYARIAKSRRQELGVSNADLLEREGRGISLFAQKWRYALDQWDGKLAEHAREKAGRLAITKPAVVNDNAASVSPDDIYEYLDIAAIKALPDPAWVVKDVIIEDALGFIYGPPGHGKTFVALNLALHVAYGMLAWWRDKPIRRPGLVLYIAREGQASFKDRITAWQRKHGIAEDIANFAMIRARINFMNVDDIAKLRRTVAAAAKHFGAIPSLIFVDTVSRSMPGADENLQKEMTIFVDACAAIGEDYKATVVGVHHAGKSGDMRGSTVLLGAGDFVLRIKREGDDGEDEGRVVEMKAEKIKDAEDGWSWNLELAAEEWTAEGSIDAERKSLVAMPLSEAKATKADRWPDVAVCRAVLKEIQAAWDDRRPWSSNRQAKSSGRYAGKRIAEGFGIGLELAEEMVDRWLNTDVIEIAERDSHSKLMGLKVYKGID